jgi:AraC-like DNA-binding protein
VFTTTGVHPRDRFDFWHEALCRRVIEHDSRPQSRLDFQAELEAGALADIGVFVLQSSPMVVAHTLHHIKYTTTDDLFVCRQIAGRLLVEQQGRDAVLEAGDFTLIDPRAPYAGEYFADSKLLVLQVPRRLLEARAGSVSEMTARAIRSVTAENSLTSEFMAMLPARIGGLDATAKTVVENQVLDLMAISLAKVIQGRKPRISSSRSLVLMKLRAEIERRLTNPALDAGSVAAAAGVSIRYANAVLAEEDTSIKRLVLTRRLACCEKALRDPLQARRTVSEIAHSWGFSDMTHFARQFRAAYGASPREYRRNAGAT